MRERSWQTEMRWTWPFTAQMCSSEASRLNSMGLENSQICLKKVLEMNLKRNHFFNMNMLSCGVLLWESWKQGAGEHCPNFPKGLFQLPSCWAHNTTHGGEVGLFSCILSHCKCPSVFALQLCAADSVPAPAAYQRHVAPGAHGSQQRRHDISLSLCHFQLPAGKLDAILSVADLGKHAAAPRLPKTCSAWANLRKSEISSEIFAFFSQREGFFHQNCNSE